MPQRCWLDGALIGVMVIGIIGTLYHRVKLEFGIGDRAIQLVGLCLIIPAVLILSLESKIQGETLGTILGAIIGYALSGIGNPDRRKKKPPEKESTAKGEQEETKTKNEQNSH